MVEGEYVETVDSARIAGFVRKGIYQMYVPLYTVIPLIYCYVIPRHERQHGALVASCRINQQRRSRPRLDFASTN